MLPRMDQNTPPPSAENQENKPAAPKVWHPMEALQLLFNASGMAPLNREVHDSVKQAAMALQGFIQQALPLVIEAQQKLADEANKKV